MSGCKARVFNHPILGPLPPGETCTITVDGEPITARKGEPVLAAMLAAGLFFVRKTDKLNEPRGLFCGIGLCTDCAVTINGRPNTRSCVTPAGEGMVIETNRSNV